MKKLVFGLIATVLTMNLSLASENLNYPADGSVEVTLKIGRKSRGCLGIGICKVEKVKIKIENISLRQQSEDKIIKIKISNVGDKLLFSFDKENSKIIEENFKGYQLTLEEDYTVDDLDVLKDLSKDKIVIKKGVYKLNYNSKNNNYELYL